MRSPATNPPTVFSFFAHEHLGLRTSSFGYLAFRLQHSLPLSSPLVTHEVA